MPETKTVLLLVPVEVEADGKHCGGCAVSGYPQPCRGHVRRLGHDDEGQLRCAWCLSAEQHPAAAPQPEPTGEGVDVILDLVERIQQHGIPTGEIAVETDRVVRALGWDLRTALLTRREQGIRTYGTPLRTHNGRNAQVDLAQELLDAMIYHWQMRLEAGEKSEPSRFHCPICAPGPCRCEEDRR